MPRRPVATNIILKLIEIASYPISSQEIHKKCHDLDRATVYRAINVLKESQQIRVVEIGDGKIRFESVKDHHHHLICLKCKETKKVELPLEEEKHLEILQSNFQKSSKFSSLQHSLEFFGLCQNCQNVKNVHK